VTFPLPLVKNLTTRQWWLLSFFGGSRLAMSQCRHRACGYLVAVDSTTQLPPPRSDDTVAAGPPLLIHQTTSVHLLYFFELIEREKIIFHV